jgi:hypothetical protein
MAQSGWGWGIILLLYSGGVTYHTGRLLGDICLQVCRSCLSWPACAACAAAAAHPPPSRRPIHATTRPSRVYVPTIRDVVVAIEYAESEPVQCGVCVSVCVVVYQCAEPGIGYVSQGGGGITGQVSGESVTRATRQGRHPKAVNGERSLYRPPPAVVDVFFETAGGSRQQWPTSSASKDTTKHAAQAAAKQQLPNYRHSINRQQDQRRGSPFSASAELREGRRLT